jgi:cytochrome-b5 reductase
LSSENINGVYIPSALLIFGTFLVKKEFVPYAVALAAVLAGLKLFTSSSSSTYICLPPEGNSKY